MMYEQHMPAFGENALSKGSAQRRRIALLCALPSVATARLNLNIALSPPLIFVNDRIWKPN
jgi:hypothetical protein